TDVPAARRADVVVDDEHLLGGLHQGPRRFDLARQEGEVFRLQPKGRRTAADRLQCVVDLDEPAFLVVEERHPSQFAPPKAWPFGIAKTSTPFPLPGSRSIAARTAASASFLASSSENSLRNPCSSTPYAIGEPLPEDMKSSEVIAPLMSLVYTWAPSWSTPATTSST